MDFFEERSVCGRRVPIDLATGVRGRVGATEFEISEGNLRRLDFTYFESIEIDIAKSCPF
jgi:hypothetical protein